MKAQEEPCASSDCPESQRRRYYSWGISDRRHPLFFQIHRSTL